MRAGGLLAQAPGGLKGGILSDFSTFLSQNSNKIEGAFEVITIFEKKVSMPKLKGGPFVILQHSCPKTFKK